MASEKITISRKSNDFNTKLLSLQRKDKFCDATLIVKEERINVHRSILAASSDNFKNAFVESKLKEISFPTANIETFQILIDFCYTGTIEIGDQQLDEIINIASVLSMCDFIKICVEKLKNRLNVQNSISIWNVSKSLCATGNLKEMAFEYIKKNFDKISQLPDFLTLEYSDIHALFSSNMVVSPMIIYEALKKWINFNADSRMTNWNDLLTYVPLSSFSQKFLFSELSSICNFDYSCAEKFFAALEKQIVDFDKENADLEKLKLALDKQKTDLEKQKTDLDKQKTGLERQKTDLDKQKIDLETQKTDLEKQKTDLEKQKTDLDKQKIDLEKQKNDQFQNRKPKCTLMAIGGKLTNNTISIEVYNINRKKWHVIKDINYDCEDFRSILINENLILVGGWFNKKNVSLYDIKTGKISTLPSLIDGRARSPIVQVEGYIYAISGFLIAYNERYDLVSRTWSKIKLMQTSRFGCEATVVDNKIYIMGGKNTSRLEYLNSTECYDPLTDTWQYRKSMNEKRADFAAAVIGKFIYVVGGQNSSGYLKTAEKYDTTTDQWTTITSTNFDRYYSAAGNLNDQLVVAGGNINESGNTVEIYDEINKKWNPMPELNIPRWSFNLISIPLDLADQLLP